MSKYLLLICSLALIGCRETTVPPMFPDISDIVDCSRGSGIFQEYIEKSILIDETTWIVDRELFYVPAIRSCIGKGIIVQKNGTQDDRSTFIIRNISKNQDIYFKTYQGAELRNENEGQKNYRKQITLLKTK